MYCCVLRTGGDLQQCSDLYTPDRSTRVGPRRHYPAHALHSLNFSRISEPSRKLRTVFSLIQQEVLGEWSLRSEVHVQYKVFNASLL